MSQVQNGSEASAAALVGSLATFSLIDVLDLLARTGHTGELQVVGRGTDRHVWVNEGDLVDATGNGNLNAILFELACRDEGWFYFSCTNGVPEGAERLTVSEVLGELGPQVEEWRSLTADLPFESIVSMSSTTPGPEVQIRADQWQLLSVIGSPGRSVREVVEGTENHALETLRTLHELVDAGLVSVGPIPEAEAAPIVGAGSASTGWGGSQGETVPGEGELLEPLPPFSVPGAQTDAPPPPAPEGWVATAATAEPAADSAEAASNGGANGEGATADTAHSVMPPPITGDPWSSSLSSETSNGDAS